ncbi:MAG: KamA family radical SAM protein [bacterium]|nr:KamA family radical SAM protein [bacterium]
MPRPKVITKLDQVAELDPGVRERLRPVAARFAFRTNSYYQSLIDWCDPADPIRRIVMPERSELNDWGELDASGEHDYTRVPGLEHKYADTALLLVNDVCGAFCRFCFRKRLFMDGNDEVSRDVSQGLAYIRRHKEISSVLLTGGDPLLLGTARLQAVLEQLRAIPHVRIIRIGSKMPAFDPFRITGDPALVEALGAASLPDRRLYVMAHFNHPRELTPEALRALDDLLGAGVIVVNQTPLLAGVNDDARVLAELFDRLAYAGIPPYYVFICRPTLGNESFSVPVEESWHIFDAARNQSCGLGRRARLAMSHHAGKIEVLCVTEREIILRIHRAADPAQAGRVLVLRRNPEARWLDDYDEIRFGGLLDEEWAADLSPADEEGLPAERDARG